MQKMFRVATDQTWKQLSGLLDQAQSWVIDLETTKFRNWSDAKILGYAIGGEVEGNFVSCYFPVGHEHDASLFSMVSGNLPHEEVKAWIRTQNRKPCIMHNAMFDYAWLLREEIEWPGFIWDTMVMAHICNENRYSYRLDDLAKALFKEEKDSLKKIEKQFGWEAIIPDIMGGYANQDVWLTYRLWIRMRAELDTQELDHLYDDYERFLRALAQSKNTGIKIDTQLAHELREQARQERSDLVNALGLDPAKPSQLLKRLHGSPAEGGLGLPVRYTSAKTSKPSADLLSLRRYSLEYPESSDFVEKVLRVRSLGKDISTWYGGLIDRVDHDGFIHSGFNMIGTRAGRISGRDPNLLQIPRRDGVKRLFLNYTDELGDWRLYQFDYSQIELRLAAYYANKVGDTTLFDSYKNGVDVHQTTANLIGADRQIGKMVNFLFIYGGGAGALRNNLFKQANLVIPLEQCEEWINQFKLAYPGIVYLVMKLKKDAIKHGYVTLWNGRKRRYQDRKFDAGELLDERDPRTAFNALLQGGAGQITMYAMVKAHELYRHDARMVNQVYDAIWWYTLGTECHAELMKCMRELPEDVFEMEFPVDIDDWRAKYD